MGTSAANLILEGIRVIDLSRVLAGPFCGAILGDMGADVIKVEDTKAGDEVRTWPPHKEGESSCFLVNNRNKRGMAIDMKKPEGVEIIRRLAREADVLIENFRTGTMEEFGLSYEKLSEMNPKLIYCSISAFGRSGPRAQEAGYEALMQAFTGVMSITGEPDGSPVRCGVAFLDLTTGILCALGAVCALYQRAHTGLGQRVDGSLLRTAIGLLNFLAQGYLLAGVVPKALGSGAPGTSPYRNFRCADDQWVFVAGANDNLWKRLAGAIGLASLKEDPRFATNIERVKNRVELERIVQEAIGRFNRKPLLKLLEEAGVPATPVNRVDQALEDAQVRAQNMIWQMDQPRLGKIPIVGFPLAFSRIEPCIRRNPPRQGEHTDEILKEYGYSSSEIAQFREKKVIL
ncbi:MAG: CoA transferase [Thermodesulfobacteriota bacterium]|jgi:crotonobetainyl-CoA:carnitine CoA-transferase CaiB-like acyl-CoA transferase